jgi:hypothetical protein
MDSEDSPDPRERCFEAVDVGRDRNTRPQVAGVPAACLSFGGSKWNTTCPPIVGGAHARRFCFVYLRKFAVTITRALTEGTVQQNRNKSMARLVTCTSPIPCCPCVLAQSSNLAEPWPGVAVRSGTLCGEAHRMQCVEK